MKKTKLQAIGAILFLLLMYSCDNELQISLPQGPTGQSAYELWVAKVNSGDIDWPKDQLTENHFFLYLKGEDGKEGLNGLSAYELWKNEVKKGIKDPHNPNQEWAKEKDKIDDFWYYLTGADGKNGSTPVIGKNGNWWIDGIDTGKPTRGADGKDGSKIEISNNQTWIIDGTDTGISVKGEDGKEGEDGSTVVIGKNGNWWIDGKDTTIPARGKDGENGKDGTNGVNGLSAYEVWVTEVMKGLDDPHHSGQKWDKSKISMDDYWNYLRGKTGADGREGADGKDGSKVVIGDNGNWYIDDLDTGIPAEGKNGDNGKDGSVVTIINGYWYIDGQNTGIEAKGDKGDKGETGQPGRDGSVVTIGNNGNWHIDGEDTGFSAFGKDGDNGLNAYELWKDEVATGNLDDPKKPGQKWATNKNTIQDFWEYLTGKKGQEGQQGDQGLSAYDLWVEEVEQGLENPHYPGAIWDKTKTSIQDFWEYLRGKDGKNGETIINGQVITIGVPNVISQYVSQEHKEFVRWSDGAVVFIVYNEAGEISPLAIVKGLPGLAPNKEYVTDTNGEFIIKKEDLPTGRYIEDLTASVEVTYKNSKGVIVTELSAPNTYVPNRITVRLNRSSTSSVRLTNATATTTLRMERNIGVPGAKWENIPNYLGGLMQSLKWYELKDKDYPTSYDESTLIKTSSYDISRPISTGIDKHHITPPYMKRPNSMATEWDGEDHFYIAKLDSYYGENPVTPLVVQVPPVQYIPTIESIENVQGYSEITNSVKRLTVVFNTSHIDPNHIYNTACDKEIKVIDGKTYEYWTPIVTPISEIENIDFLKISFVKSGGGSGGDLSVDNRYALASLKENNAKVENVHFQSAVYVNGSAGYFVEPDKKIGTISYSSITQKLTLIGFKDETMNMESIENIEIN